jgi:ATPase subunit of ABC transporter with duplicated ATPase domains
MSFSVDTRLSAFVGPNGSGKTSLAKLIAGELVPTTGHIQRNGSTTLFRQREEAQSVRVSEFVAADYEWSLLGEHLLRDIDKDALCTKLSGGEWMRVRLARALAADFLILDEPTNDLDREGRAAVLQFLRDRNRQALLISHDRECLELCEEIVELSNRGVQKFGGGWSAYSAAKAFERERLNAALDTAKRERDAVITQGTEQRMRQEKRNRRGAQSAARGGSPKILLGTRKRRAQTTTGMINAATLERSHDAVRAAHEALNDLKIEPVMYADVIGREIPAQKLVAEARDFNIRLGTWVYAEDLNFAWRGNVRAALRGSNGSGKTTLLQALLGHEFQTRGELRHGALNALYLDQRCSSLNNETSVLDNVRAVSSASEGELRNALARFLFAKDAVFQRVGELSGGERLRAALAQGLLSGQQPELLLLDEPTNNLDLANIEFLERIVSEFRGALVVISHDERFLANCGISQELTLRAARHRRRRVELRLQR